MELDHQSLSLDNASVPKNNNEVVVFKKEKLSLEPFPIVYTTKLDDMTVFKADDDRLTPDTIIDCIIKESKPKLRQLKKYPKHKSKITFHTIVQTLQKINHKSQGNNKTSCSRSSSERKSIHKNTDISEAGFDTPGYSKMRKRRRIDINSQTETCNPESYCEIIKERKECDPKTKSRDKYQIVDSRQESSPHRETKTIAHKDICTKKEALKIIDLESNCETVENRKEDNPVSKLAMKRKLIDNRKESNLQLNTEIEDVVICENEEFEICNTVITKKKISLTGHNLESKQKLKLDPQAVSLEDTAESDCEIIEDTKEPSSKLNTKTTVDNLTHKSCKELLKICKPVSVVLKDIKHLLDWAYIAKNNKDVDTNIIAEDKTSPGFTSFSSKNNLKNKFFLCYDEFLGELDIYYIDGIGHVTDYYKIKGDPSILNRTALQPYIKGKEAFLIRFCCWHHRVQTINTMWPCVISFSASKFIRKPHLCAPGNCICCCLNKDQQISNNSNQIFKSITNDKSTKRQDFKPFPCVTASVTIDETPSVEDAPVSTDDNEIINLEKEISSAIIQMQENLVNLVNIKHKNVWLRQLLSTNSDSRSLINKALSYTTQTSDNNKATFKNTCIETSDKSRFLKVVTKDNNNKTEFYELTQNGDVVECDKRYIRQVPNSHNYETIDTCCWVRRERLISKVNDFIDKKKERTTYPAIKFLKKAHLCPAGNCKCCCKNTKKPTLPLKNIALPKQAISKKIATKQAKKYVKGHNRITINLVTATNQNYDCLNPPRLVPILPKPTIEKPEDQDVVNSLITTILDTFKDVRLTITEDGKVAAALNTPINSLSTAELKVLSNILSHVQEHVKALGLTPGTNLNDRLMRSNTSSLITNNTPSTNNTSIKLNNSGTPHNTPLSGNFTQSTQEPRANPYKLPIAITNHNYISHIYKQKCQNYINSFKSHLNNVFKEALPISTETHIPRIENVFSLQADNFDSSSKVKSDLSTLRAIWDKPKKGNSEEVSNSDVNKVGIGISRKAAQNKTSSKIRVVAPSKLGVSDNHDQNPLLLNNPEQLRTIKSTIENATLIPGQHINKDLTTHAGNSHTSMVIQVCSGVIQLIPVLSQTISNIQLAQQIDVNYQLSEDAYKNVQRIPLANNKQLLQQKNQVNTGDIPLAQRTTEIDPEERLIPEFRIIKPTTSLPFNSKPTGSFMKPYETRGNDEQYLRQISAADHQEKTTQAVTTPIMHTLQPIQFNATPQQMIDNTIDQVFNDSENLNTRLQKLLEAPRKLIRLEEREKELEDIEQNLSITSHVIQTNKKTLVSKSSNSHKMASKADQAQETIENHKTINYGKLQDDSDIGEFGLNIFEEVRDSSIITYGPNDNENEDDDDNEVCILGM